jgi:hypothetical protein
MVVEHSYDIALPRSGSLFQPDVTHRVVLYNVNMRAEGTA